MARILSTSLEDLNEAAQQLRAGGLVAFPTETVYGLGAHLEEKALAQIFAAKKRPYSDPLIVHYAKAEEAKKAQILTEEESVNFDKLSEAFWPGPLTIIAPATSAIPPLVMAGTGCVGVRVPVHPIAHQLLEICQEPIAAPSANLFCHISPTTAEHVNTDLGQTPGLLIISGGNSTIGIESTVVKLHGKTLSILRPGFITESMIEAVIPGCFDKSALPESKASSPGHEMKHYSPNIVTFLIQPSGDNPEERIDSKTILIDFGRYYSSLASSALRYFDLSPVGSVKEAIVKIYDVLREAENTLGAEKCFIVDVASVLDHEDPIENELAHSLNDRLLRSAAHQVRTIKLQ